MENARIFGIVGFLAVVAPFGVGMMGTLSAGEDPQQMQASIAEPEPPARPTYLSYGMPVTTSLSKFDKHVTVSLSFMIDRGSAPATELQDQIDARDGRLEAVLIDAIIEAGEAVVNAEDLRIMIPRMARHALNTQVGDENDPSPVHEVLITAFAMQ